MSKVLIMGDVHAEKKWFMNSFLVNNDINICIQLGDFGFIWKYSDILYNKFLNMFEKRFPDKIIFTVLGNHENYDLINKFPIVEKCGAQCRKIRENVYAVLRGEVLEIDGKSYLCIGGADSTDKEWRISTEEIEDKPRSLWWPQEQITMEDVNNALNNLRPQSMKCDYVCSHAEPYWFIRSISSWMRPSISEQALNDLSMQIDFDMWFGGHIHENFYSEFHDKKCMSLAIGGEIIINDGVIEK